MKRDPITRKDEAPLFWPIRLLFYRQVRCHMQGCNLPAVWKCVNDAWGKDFARDPLCNRHGQAGPCPTSDSSIHVEIPKAQQWERKRLYLRWPWRWE
jgi:hypothetical protein